MRITQEQVVAWIRTFGKRIQERKQELTELDQAIGDGDHGINMARGFTEVEQKLSAQVPGEIGAVFQLVAITLLAKVGGASGPLYSTAFLKMAQAWKGQANLGYGELARGLREATEGVKARGKAQQGEKTMVDVWEPVTQYVETHASLSWPELRRRASEALMRTKEMEAKRGRASYLGPRSIGHLDPGAASTYYLFESLCVVMEEGVKE